MPFPPNVYQNFTWDISEINALYGSDDLPNILRCFPDIAMVVHNNVFVLSDAHLTVVDPPKGWIGKAGRQLGFKGKRREERKITLQPTDPPQHLYHLTFRDRRYDTGPTRHTDQTITFPVQSNEDLIDELRHQPQAMVEVYRTVFPWHARDVKFRDVRLLETMKDYGRFISEMTS